MGIIEEVDKGVELFNKHSLQGRLLTVNKVAPRGTIVERPSQAGSSNKIYVGNLPWQVDDEHGKFLEARVVYDRETGCSLGFGFVTYSSTSEVNDAIVALDETYMDGRPIRVNIVLIASERSDLHYLS